MYYSDLLPQFNSKKEIKKQFRKPKTLPVLEENIPDELKQLNQWVCWAWRWTDGEWKKIPINPFTGEFAATDNPATWSSFEKAWTRYSNPNRTLDGIGFVFAGTDLTGADFDQCRFTDGSVRAGEEELVDSFGSYAELSPSGGGYKVICRVSPALSEAYQNKCGDYEQYQTTRFFCVTGHVLGTKSIVTADDAFRRFAESKLKPRIVKTEAETAPITEEADQTMPEDEFSWRFSQAMDDGKFVTLFNTTPSDHTGYPSASECVAALVSKIKFWFGNDFAAADKVFRQSSLFAEHWIGKWERLGQDEFTAAACEKTYTLPTGWRLRMYEAKIDGLLKSKVKIDERSLDTLAANEKIEAYESKLKEIEVALNDKVRAGVKTMYTIEDLLQLPDPTFLVDDHLPEGSFAVVCGSPGSYKSFWAVDLGLCIATGSPFMDCWETKQGQVLYMAGEGFAGFKGRSIAWCKSKNNGQYPKNFVFRPGRLDLCCPKRSGIITILEECLKNNINHPTLIVVDTKARFFTGNENDGEDTGRFVEAIDKIREATGAAVLIVDHTPKYIKTIARGHSALMGAADVIFNMVREEGKPLVEIHNTKMKDANELTSYTLRSHEILVAPEHPKLKLQFSLVLNHTSEQVVSQEDKDKMRSAYLSFKTGDTIDQAFQKWGEDKGSKPTFRRLVDKLLEREAIRYLEEGTGRKPSTYQVVEFV